MKPEFLFFLLILLIIVYTLLRKTFGKKNHKNKYYDGLISDTIEAITDKLENKPEVFTMKDRDSCEAGVISNCGGIWVLSSGLVMRPEGIDIGVSLQQKQRLSSAVKLILKDAGINIAKSNLEKIKNI